MRFAMLIFLVGCGASETHAASSPDDFPSLQGRPVYASALSGAPEDVSTVWSLVEEALASDLASDAALDAADEEAWARDRGQLIQRLDPEWGRLARGDVGDRLFAAITRALLFDDLAARVQSPERKAEAVGEARRAYAICVREASGAAEILQDWSATCLERSRALEPHEDK